MLDFMRSRVQSVWTKILFSIIVLVFVFWGVESFNDEAPVQTVATVNEDPISLKEFQHAYRNAESHYQQVYKGRFTPELVRQLNLRQQTLDQLIDAKLMADEARRIGFRASDEEVRDEISAFPAFQGFGSFSSDRYRRVLRYLQMTPREFEERQRDRIVAIKLQKFIDASARATDHEVEELFHFEQEQIDLAFIKIASGDLVDKVTVDEQQVQNFYDINKESFREPERIRFTYVTYTPEEYQSAVTISKQDVQKYYDTNKAEQYTEEQQVHARHILFSIPANASEGEKGQIRTSAETTLKRAKSGEDFATLAGEYSEDTQTAENGGDLGLFARGRMVEPFEEAAFSMAVGEISDLVETSFGVHIIKVEAIQSERVKPLDEVVDEITGTLRTQGSREVAENRAREDRAKITDDMTLSQFAEAIQLRLDETPLVAKNETIPGLGSKPKLIQTASELALQGISEPVRIDENWYVVSLHERIESRIPELADVQLQVEKRYRGEQAEQLAEEKAQKLHAHLKKTKNIKNLAKAEGLTVEETGPFARRGNYIPKIGNIPELKTAAFQLTPEEPVVPKSYAWGGNAFVAVLKEHIPADSEELEKQRDDLRKSLLERKQAAANLEFIRYLKEQSSIEYNQQTLLGAS